MSEDTTTTTVPETKTKPEPTILEPRELSMAEATELYNKLAEKPIKKFKSHGVAIERLTEVLGEKKDRVIMLLKPDLKKRGKAARIHAAYSPEPMLRSEFIVNVMGTDGLTRNDAMRALRYDDKHQISATILPAA